MMGSPPVAPKAASLSRRVSEHKATEAQLSEARRQRKHADEELQVGHECIVIVLSASGIRLAKCAGHA